MTWQDYTTSPESEEEEEEVEVETVYEPEDIFLPKEDDLEERSSYVFDEQDGLTKSSHNSVSVHLDSDTANIVNAICNAITYQKNVNLTLSLSDDTKEFLKKINFVTG
jgi:hypothetical protein